MIQTHKDYQHKDYQYWDCKSSDDELGLLLSPARTKILVKHLRPKPTAVEVFRPRQKLKVPIEVLKR